MLQLTPQSRIFLATHPVDFRNGIDGLAAVCRQRLGADPLEVRIPRESCHPFHTKVATDSTAKLPLIP